MGLSLMSKAVNDVQFPIANGNVSRLLKRKNSKFNDRNLQIDGGNCCNLQKVIPNLDLHFNIFLLVLRQVQDPQKSKRTDLPRK